MQKKGQRPPPVVDPAIVSFGSVAKALPNGHIKIAGQGARNPDIPSQPAHIKTATLPPPNKGVSNDQAQVPSQQKPAENPPSRNEVPQTHILPLPQQAQLTPRVPTQRNGALNSPKWVTGPAPGTTPLATFSDSFSELPLNGHVDWDGAGSKNPEWRQIPKPLARVAQSIPARKEFFTPKKTSKRGKRAGKAPAERASTGATANLPTTNPNEEGPPCRQPEPPMLRGKIQKGRYKGIDCADQNGWATEDATDIQDLGMYFIDP